MVDALDGKGKRRLAPTYKGIRPPPIPHRRNKNRSSSWSRSRYVCRFLTWNGQFLPGSRCRLRRLLLQDQKLPTLRSYKCAEWTNNRHWYALIAHFDLQHGVLTERGRRLPEVQTGRQFCNTWLQWQRGTHCISLTKNARELPWPQTDRH